MFLVTLVETLLLECQEELLLYLTGKMTFKTFIFRGRHLARRQGTLTRKQTRARVVYRLCKAFYISLKLERPPRSLSGLYLK